MDAVRAALGLPPRAPFYTSSATPPVPNTESHNYGGLMGSGGAAPVDKASMGRAQRRTADSLAALAQSMRVTGKLEEAISIVLPPLRELLVVVVVVVDAMLLLELLLEVL